MSICTYLLAFVIRVVESYETLSASNLSLRLFIPGVVSFPVLSRNPFLCLDLLKGSEFLVEAMVFAL